jgi:ABC-type sugar transport system ATPase subunit
VATGDDTPVLEARGLTKDFPGVRALDGVGLACRPGRVHAVIGENGAGKSTLVRVLTGQMQPDSGELTLDGTATRFDDPRQALAAGVVTVHQELTLLPAMSVADNVMLGQEPVHRRLLDRRRQQATAREALERVGLGALDLSARAETLSLATQQLIEIARALVRRSRLLILDEPSAVLDGDQLDGLLDLLRQLAGDGVSIVYISHRLDEVGRIADDLTVMRDGRTVSTGPAGEYDVARMVREMVGRDVDTVFPALRDPGSGTLLSARDLTPEGDDTHLPGLDLDIRPGEVVGLAGLLGSGRSRLLRTLAGVHPRERGSVTVDGAQVRPGIRSALRAGIALVPEERKTEGLVLPLPVRANTTLADIAAVGRYGWLSPQRERAMFEEDQGRIGIRASSGDQRTVDLSGGNQQKVVLAKWLRTQPKVLMLDEPTRGIDVGAKAEIYRIIAELAGQGIAVLVASSELTEVIGMAHRVLVCRAGRVVGELTGDAIDEEHVMHLALGTTEVPA